MAGGKGKKNTEPVEEYWDERHGRGSREYARYLVSTLLAQPQGVTVKEATEKAGISRPTFYRKLRELERRGLQVIKEEGPLLSREARYKILNPPKDLRDIPLRVHFSEMLALQFIRGFSRLYDGTTIADDIDNVFQMIVASLPAKAIARMKDLDRIFIPIVKFPKNYAKPGMREVIDDLTEAVLDRKQCKITYQSPTDKKPKEISAGPLHFFEFNRGLYLFALMLDFGEVRQLAVDRIKSVDVSDTTFVYPKGFDPVDRLEFPFTIFEGEPITATIRFSQNQAFYIRERRWAKKQTIKENADGTIDLTLETSGRWDIIRWVLGYGSEAEIIAPKDLRDEVAETLKAMTGKYGR